MPSTKSVFGRIFSNFSALVESLCKRTVKGTFENVCLRQSRRLAAAPRPPCRKPVTQIIAVLLPYEYQIIAILLHEYQIITVLLHEYQIITVFLHMSTKSLPYYYTSTNSLPLYYHMSTKSSQTKPSRYQHQIIDTQIDRHIDRHR